jgi:hypothetical protein
MINLTKILKDNDKVIKVMSNTIALMQYFSSLTYHFSEAGLRKCVT